jgi:hypothetical protein
MRRVCAKFGNTPCHESLLVRQFLPNKNIIVCPHSLYSQALASYDFWLFPKVKMTMKGKRFEPIQYIEGATTAQLQTLTKEDFRNCFRKWKGRWDVFEVRGINGNVSFTVIIYFFIYSPYFFITPCKIRGFQSGV